MLRNYIAKATRTLQKVLRTIQPSSAVMSEGDGKRPLKDEEATGRGKPKRSRVWTEDAPTGDKARLGNKKKVAMLMVFCGKGYYGMQRTGQEGIITIEDELAKALLLAEAIPQDHHDTLQKMSFQRAARTDKGVSAAGQVVSLKMRVDIENLVEQVNSFLKPQIRVLAYKRTTKTFNCKNWCSSRTYSYMMPTFAFAPFEQAVVEDYRVTPEIIERVNSLLSQYKGTHNFHNFTSGKKPDDASAKRYIMEMDCGQPFERDGLEWVVIKVKGQSFMIHQIRKMIGMVIAIVRGMAAGDCIERAWGEEKFDVPKAPGVGLMLEQLHYDQYNRIHGSDKVHDPIEWSEYKEQIDAFKEEYIYPTMIETEKNDKSMMEWLATLHLHTFEEKRGPDDNSSPMARAHRKILFLKKQNEAEKAENESSEEKSTKEEECNENAESAETDNDCEVQDKNVAQSASS